MIEGAIINFPHHRVITISIPLGNTLHLPKGSRSYLLLSFPLALSPLPHPLHPKFILLMKIKGSTYASHCGQAYKDFILITGVRMKGGEGIHQISGKDLLLRRGYWPS